MQWYFILYKLYHEKCELIQAHNELLVIIKWTELMLFFVAEDLTNRAIIGLNFYFTHPIGRINEVKL